MALAKISSFYLAKADAINPFNSS